MEPSEKGSRSPNRLFRLESVKGDVLLAAVVGIGGLGLLLRLGGGAFVTCGSFIASRFVAGGLVLLEELLGFAPFVLFAGGAQKTDGEKAKGGKRSFHVQVV